MSKIYPPINNSKMEIVEVAVESVTPYDNNPRKIPQESIDRVAASIREFGWKQPIVVDKDMVIIVGHTRLMAAKKLGYEKVPVLVASDLSPEKARAYRLADNKTNEASEWDYNLLGFELGGGIDDIDMTEFGFTLDEFGEDDFGEDFNLPDGDKSEIVQMSFVLHQKQADAIKSAMALAGESEETFGNTNSNGNKLYEVVRQWLTSRT